MHVSRRLLLSVFAVVSAAACSDYESATNLNPEGPPMLRQVRLFHRVFDANNPNVNFQRRVFGFGTHELANPDEVVPNVTTALALNNDMRLIIDELLVGNNLEEIKCRGVIGPDINNRFSRVPIGANPDDIAACAGPDDTLSGTCRGQTAVCICAIPDEQGGCLRDSGTAVPFGQPMGVEDKNADGTFDDTQFIADAMQILCDGGAINVPLKLNGADQMIPPDSSYWNPSGDQNRPSTGGFEALGPAIILKADGPMPTNTLCEIVAAPTVVDKEGRQLCAPAGGEIAAGCEEGDMSAFQFTVEPLFFNPGSWGNGEEGVSRTNPALFFGNTFLKAATIVDASFQIFAGPEGADVALPDTAFDVTFMATRPQEFTISYTGPLAADTRHRIVVTPAVQDIWDQPPPNPIEFIFTTGAN
jgi:hypothetical protein